MRTNPALGHPLELKSFEIIRKPGNQGKVSQYGPYEPCPLVLDSSWLHGFLIINLQASSSLSYLLEIARSPQGERWKDGVKDENLRRNRYGVPGIGTPPALRYLPINDAASRDETQKRRLDSLR